MVILDRMVTFTKNLYYFYSLAYLHTTQVEAWQILVFSLNLINEPIKIRKVPKLSTFPTYSGVSKETLTCDIAPKL